MTRKIPATKNIAKAIVFCYALFNIIDKKQMEIGSIAPSAPEPNYGNGLKRMFIGIIVMCTIIATFAIVVTEPCDSADALGCLGEIVLWAPALPAIPAVLLINYVFDQFFHPVHVLYGMPSLVKFFPILIITIHSFGLGYLFFWYRAKKYPATIETQQEIKKWKWAFLGYAFGFAAVVSLYVFAQSGVAPFASASRIYEACMDNHRDDLACTDNFMHYQFPNCQGQTKYFLYPYKQEMPAKDKCMFDELIKQKPFIDTDFYQDFEYVSDTYIAKGERDPDGDGNLIYPNNPIGHLILYFDQYIKDADTQTRADFCNGLSNNLDRKESDRSYCRVVLDVSETVSSEDCQNILSNQQTDTTNSQVQVKCLDQIELEVYDPKNEDLDRLFPGWTPREWARFEKLKTEMHGGISFFELQYDYTINVSQWNDIKILETPVGGPTYNNLYVFDSTYKPYSINFSEDVYQRVGVVKKTVGGTDVFVEDVSQNRTMQDGTVKSLEIFKIVHFVKNKTYVRISNEYGSMNEAAMLQVVESILR